jgi:hypothetical protein
MAPRKGDTKKTPGHEQEIPAKARGKNAGGNRAKNVISLKQ